MRDDQQIRQSLVAYPDAPRGVTSVGLVCRGDKGVSARALRRAVARSARKAKR